jgi:hypothetical protein
MSLSDEARFAVIHMVVLSYPARRICASSYRTFDLRVIHPLLEAYAVMDTGFAHGDRPGTNRMLRGLKFWCPCVPLAHLPKLAACVECGETFSMKTLATCRKPPQYFKYPCVRPYDPVFSVRQNINRSVSSAKI